MYNRIIVVHVVQKQCLGVHLFQVHSFSLLSNNHIHTELCFAFRHDNNWMIFQSLIQANILHDRVESYL